MVVATITADPRFQLARTLLLQSPITILDSSNNGDCSSSSSSSGEEAIRIFGTLLEECRSTCGDTSPNAALCQLEYGNALFRAVVRRRPLSDDGGDGAVRTTKDDEDTKLPAASENGEAMTMTSSSTIKRSVDVAVEDADEDMCATKRVKIDANESDSTGKHGQRNDGSTMEHAAAAATAAAAVAAESEKDDDQGDDDNEDGDIDDLDLAFEIMDACWSILLSHDDDDDDGDSENNNEELQVWAKDQLSRVLRCIGDLHSFREQHANAADAYIRSMKYREEAWERMAKKKTTTTSARSVIAATSNKEEGGTELLTVEKLRCKRLLVESYALVAEALLSCPDGKDVIAHHPNIGTERFSFDISKSLDHNVIETLLAKDKDRLDIARSHYELAREGLEDVLCMYGKMVAATKTATSTMMKLDLKNEKEDIGYLVMTVVGVGNAINE